MKRRWRPTRSSPWRHAKLAQSYDPLGRGQKAEDASRRAVELADGLPDAERFMILAQAARSRVTTRLGSTPTRICCGCTPTTPSCTAELAALYEADGSYDEALEHLRITLEADPRNITANLAQGRVLIKSGSPSDALAPLNQALSLAIQADNYEAEANTLQALGIAYNFLGQTDKRSRTSRSRWPSSGRSAISGGPRPACPRSA